jgi:hypothetical protein
MALVNFVEGIVIMFAYQDTTTKDMITPLTFGGYASGATWRYSTVTMAA